MPLMTSTRTTVAALAATLVAALALVPGAHAWNNDGRYKLSIEAGHHQIGDAACGDYKILYDAQIDFKDAAVERDDYVAAFQAVDQAASVHNDAKTIGCGWAWVS
jgi:hypothetical protein